MENVWEELISLHAVGETEFEVLPPAAEHKSVDAHPTDWSTEGPALDEALLRDTFPLPLTADREGYYGPHHYSYWASGARDTRLLLEAVDRLGVDLRAFLDFGCATGRVLRHIALAPDREVAVMGCDINRRHTDWVARHLPPEIAVFQNHSIPTLPLPDNSLDAVTAYSVFTHIEAFETAWLMELRRVLRPGGIAWVTIQSEKTWADMHPGWPIYDALSTMADFEPYLENRGALPRPRMIFRSRNDRSYSSNVFYHRAYIHQTWGRILSVAEEHNRYPDLQDVVILRKD